MSIGLLFGSFNPIHMGHLIAARYWLNETDLSQIWLVVSPQNPHKPAVGLAPAYHRIQMARLASEGDPRLLVSDIEFARTGPSYTIDTLRLLKELYEDVEWILLLGSDAAANLEKWKEGPLILREWRIWIYPRRHVPLERLPKGAKIEFFPEAPQIDLSATQIRAYCQAGKSIRYLVPPLVESYIYRHDLYVATSPT
ncbi:MAG: nicotinate (nicotinamide) nucleotide adenylyltransferase [Bacteroidia bacterium]|nr:nicotinate (nicotinamide) nucleotide adenylyltransferase [Bacteroidia bacterium]MDW8014932.1 nicotinate (nicotinamide) nucleotide adenylyltransferase [Bacteroidia bacterium]